jgi:uncharacterized protein (DUF1800 family)
MGQQARTAAFLIAIAVVVHDVAPLAARPLLSNGDTAIAHLLTRLGYGPRSGDIDRARVIGLVSYIDQQLGSPYPTNRYLQQRLATLESIGLQSRPLTERYYLPAILVRRQRQLDTRSDQRPVTTEDRTVLAASRVPLQELSAQKVLRAVHSEGQLEEVLVDFWFNHFNVFAGKGAVRNYLTEYEREVIRPHVLGNFREMLGAVARSPAMLFYLDNWMSVGNTSSPRPVGNGRRLRLQRPAGRSSGLNENYGRELLELHTVGVDGGYTQADIVDVARAFTGWTIDAPRQGGGYRFDSRRHDDGEKRILGHRFPPGGGQQDGERVLDILAAHYATAKHLATKLGRRFISDAPPAAFVQQVASVFLQTRGDLRAVTRAVITSPDFQSAANYRAKIRSPFEYVVASLRACDATVQDASALVTWIRELGQPLYGAQPPTGYAETAEAWVGAGALLARMNFAVALANNRVRGAECDLSQRAPATEARFADHLVARVLHGNASASTRNTIASAPDLATALAVALGSPEFQRK